MTGNPYQTPQTTSNVTGVISGTREDLRKVATYQKGILVCILIYLVCVFGQFLLPVGIRPILMLIVLINVLIGAVFVFLLAIKTYGTGLGVVFGILTIVPLIGLIALLIVNGKATKILKQNGVEVGLLGAKKMSSI